MTPIIKSVRGPDGAIQLFDIFVNDEWHGSRRTSVQCVLYLRSIGAYARRGTTDDQPQPNGGYQ